MISKYLFLILAGLTCVACSDENKKTIGTPGSFSPLGREFALTPNLSASAMAGLVAVQNFPILDAELNFRDPQVEDLLLSLSENRSLSQMEGGSTNGFEWLKVDRSTFRFRMTSLAPFTLLELWQGNPVSYSRLIVSGNIVHSVHKTPRELINYVYATDCSHTMLKSKFEMDRKNSILKLKPGAPCEGLAFYRENEIPGLVLQLRDLERIEENKAPVPPQLESFYEVL